MVEINPWVFGECFPLGSCPLQKGVALLDKVNKIVPVAAEDVSCLCALQHPQRDLWICWDVHLPGVAVEGCQVDKWGKEPWPKVGRGHWGWYLGYFCCPPASCTDFFFFFLWHLTNYPISLSLGVLLYKLKMFLHLKRHFSGRML